MKYIFLILFVSSPLLAQNEIIVQPTDKDSLWQMINEVYTLDGVVVIKNVHDYGFILRQGTEEFICNTNTMPKGFIEKVKRRKQKFI